GKPGAGGEVNGAEVPDGRIHVLARPAPERTGRRPSDYPPRARRMLSAAPRIAVAQSTGSFGFLPLLAFVAALPRRARRERARLRRRAAFFGGLPSARSTRCTAVSSLLVTGRGTACAMHAAPCTAPSIAQRALVQPPGSVVELVSGSVVPVVEGSDVAVVGGGVVVVVEGALGASASTFRSNDAVAKVSVRPSLV